LAWWTKPATLQVAQVEGKTVHSTAARDLEGPVDGLDAAASGGTIVALVATAASLSVYEIADGEVSERIPVVAERAVAPGICAVGGEFVVGWISTSSRELQLRKVSLAARDFPSLSAGEGRGGAEKPRSMCLLGAYRDQVALTWTVSEGGQRGDLSVAQFAAVYDATRGELGPAESLGPGAAYLAGGWIGDVLVVIHGADAPLASAFRLAK
jgi:hypothetical protein